MSKVTPVKLTTSPSTASVPTVPESAEAKTAASSAAVHVAAPQLATELSYLMDPLTERNTGSKTSRRLTSETSPPGLLM